MERKRLCDSKGFFLVVSLRKCTSQHVIQLCDSAVRIVNSDGPKLLGGRSA